MGNKIDCRHVQCRDLLAVHPYFNSNSGIETKGCRQPSNSLRHLYIRPRCNRPYPVRTQSPRFRWVASSGSIRRKYCPEQPPAETLQRTQVKACRGVTGKEEAVVQFEYDGVIPSWPGSSLSSRDVHSISVWAIDTDGNVHFEDYGLITASSYSIATFEGHTGRVESVSFSPDGATLASAGGVHDQTVKLWDVGTRELIATLEGHAAQVSSVSFSPDGVTLAAGTWGNSIIAVGCVETVRRSATLRA